MGTISIMLIRDMRRGKAVEGLLQPCVTMPLNTYTLPDLKYLSILPITPSAPDIDSDVEHDGNLEHVYHIT
jgi:hypothetical protein